MKFRFFLSLLLVVLSLAFSNFPARSQEVGWIKTLDISGNQSDQAHAVAISGDGQTLVVSNTAGIVLIDLPRLEQRAIIPLDTWAYSLSFSPKGSVVYAALFDGTVAEIDINLGKILNTFKVSDEWVRTVAINADGSSLVTSSDDSQLKVWSSTDRTIINQIDLEGEGLRAAAISEDGSLVAGVLRDHTVKVWDTVTGEEKFALTGHTDWPRKLVFSPDGKWLFSGGFDKNIIQWDLSNGTSKSLLSAHTSSVLSLAISPDGESIASGSVDETIRIWDVKTGRSTNLFSPGCGFVYGVAFDPTGSNLAAACENGQVKIIDLAKAPTQTEAELVGPMVSSDCRSCHHLQTGGNGVRVPQMSCTVCHDSGANLNWCPIFPRAKDGPSIFKMSPVKGISGISLGSSGTIIRLTTPSNGESYYSSNNYIVPGFIKGQVISGGEKIDGGNVEITITSSTGNVYTDSAPIENGVFSRQFRMNDNQVPAGTNFNHSTDCTVCHHIPTEAIGLLAGTYNVKVSYTSPTGVIVSDSRTFNVDIPDTISLPINLIDSKTNQGLAGVTVQANIYHLGWRERVTTATTDDNGMANLPVDLLPEKENTLSVSMLPAFVDGQPYEGEKPIQLTISQGQQITDPVVLLGKTSKGEIAGMVKIAGTGTPAVDGTVGLFKLPSGPLLQTKVEKDGTYLFPDLVPSNYLLHVVVPNQGGIRSFADPVAVSVEKDVTTTVALEVSNAVSVAGQVLNEKGEPLPFAWVRSDDSSSIVPSDLMGGNFSLPILPENKYSLFIAPGYFARSEGNDTNQPLVINLEPRPDLAVFSWGKGSIYIPSETSATKDPDGYRFEFGWMWGTNKESAEPLLIRTADANIMIDQGSFSLVKLGDSLTWLTMQGGEAMVTTGLGDQVTLKEGQTMALEDPNSAMEYDPNLNMILWHTDSIPVREVYSPNVATMVREILIKAGVTTIRSITFFYVHHSDYSDRVGSIPIFWNSEKDKEII